jgi:putative transposase
VFLGLHYQSPELQRLRDKAKDAPVDILVNRHDLDSISVLVGNQRMSVPAVFREIAGTCVREWVAVGQYLKRRNADMAALSAGIVRTAMEDMREHAAIAAKRAEIGEPVLSEADLEKAERELFLSFAFAEKPPASDEDLLGADLHPAPAAPPAASPLHGIVDDEFGGPADWMEE